MTDATATDAKETEVLEHLDDLLVWAWQPALRMALDAHGAPTRCRRRACRMAGECRMTVKEGAPLDCGGGLTDETIMTACVAVQFGSMMVQRFVADVMAPE